MQQPGPDTPLYSVAAVTLHTGVPAVTLRAWERRYGFPKPSRARGGRRLYTERDISRVRDLRSQTGRGVPISRAIALLRDADRSPAIAESTAGAPPIEVFGRQLLDAFLDMAPARAEAVLSEALSQVAVEDVCLGLIQPTLNEIGRRWHAGEEAAIAQEHFATALVRARLTSMLHQALRHADQPSVLAACPEGEWHELGLLTVCLFLARRGVSVRYLGPNLPAQDFADVAARVSPALVIGSAQTAATAEELILALEQVEAQRPRPPHCAYGGWIFNTHPALRSRTPGTFLGPDAGVAAERASALLGRPPMGADRA